jgi:hypothetical protein
MARGRAEAQRSTQYAWLITGPFALFAVAAAAGVAATQPNAAGEWPLAAVFLAIFVAAEAAVSLRRPAPGHRSRF